MASEEFQRRQKVRRDRDRKVTALQCAAAVNRGRAVSAAEVLGMARHFEMYLKGDGNEKDQGRDGVQRDG